MASQLAIQLRHRVEAYLGRGLSFNQIKHCEEIIINFKPWVPLRFLEGLEKTLVGTRQRSRNWGLFYFPLYALAREFRGFTRRADLVFLVGRMHRIYRQCDLMAGDGYEEKDLSSILFLVEECSDQEIEATFTIARTYGLRTVRHLRGIILKNRAVAVLPHLKSLKLEDDEAFKQKLTQWANSKYPDVGMLRGLYKHRINNIVRGKSRLRFVWDELEELNKETTDDKPDERSTA